MSIAPRSGRPDSISTPGIRAEIVDVSHTGRVDQIVEMLKSISLARSPADVLRAFASRYWPLRPVDFLLSASIRDLPAPKYRITRAIDVRSILEGRSVYNIVETWRNREAIPVHEGGLVWELIKDGRPKLIHHLDAADDPIVGELLGEMRSCMVSPLFDEGQPRYWTMSFRREPAAFAPEEFEQNLVIGNLLGGTNTRLLLTDEITKLNAKLRSQFEEVARVQRALLPRQIPEIPGLEIATSYLTSDEAGGDYYDFFRLPDGRWGFLIADVSGHGAAAATVMAMLHGILHAHVAHDRGTAPDDVLRYANARLIEANVEGSFVTAFFAVYEPATGVVRFARAGHNPPILKRIADRRCVELDGDAAGLPLGVFDDYQIACEEVRLSPGDTLVLYTDGITEAFSRNREMFGPKRLIQAIDAIPCHPDAIVDAVHKALFEHTGGSRTRSDDQTLVALRRRPGA